MRKLWLLGLALPLAGCAQRAELAPRQNATPPGPFTLRYHFDAQQPDRYHVTATGDTTTSFTRGGTAPSSTAPANPPANSPATGSTPPREAVHATFQTEMVLNLSETPATASADTTPDDTGTSASNSGAAGSAHSTDSGTGLNAPASETPDTPGASGGGSAAATTLPSRIDQKIDQWSASVTLPDRQAPNQFQGSYRDDNVSVTTGGIPMPVPDRFKTQVQSSLQQPITLTVTDLGEIRNVLWSRPAMPADSSDTRPISFLTRSTAALNLWAGVIRLPEHSVNVGDSWNTNDSFPVQGDTNGATVHLERTGHYILRNVTQDGPDEVAVVDSNEMLKLMPGPVPATAAPTTSGDNTPGNTSAAGGKATGSTANTNAPGTPPAGSTGTSTPGSSQGNSTSGGATGTGSSAPSAADANALAVQTRSGTVYFDITRGWVDHADEQFTLRWGNRFMAGTNNTAPAAAHESEGQAQGKVTVQRVDTGYTLAPSTSPSTAANVPSTSGTTSPGAPTTNVPAPATGSASNTPATP